MRRSAASLALVAFAAVVAAYPRPAEAQAPPVLVKDIVATPVDPSGSPSPAFARLGSTFFFTGRTFLHGAELWRSDGTTGGTTEVADLLPGMAGPDPANIAAAGSRAWFGGSDTTHGYEPWITDGTAPGTHLVADVNPGAAASGPTEFTSVNGRVAFIADDGTHGKELWQSDGTPGNTSLVLDIQPGAGGAFSSGEHLVEMNGVVYFFANDGAHGVELWRSDGTAGGTSRVTDIQAGAASGIPSSAAQLYPLNGLLYFAANDGAHGVELWRSDGTPGGTAMLADIEVGSGSSGPLGFTALGNTVVFSACDTGSGCEPWKTNGVVTTRIADVAPGGASGVPTTRPFVTVGGLVYFWGNNGATGVEPWRTDGTAVGTALAADVNPAGSSVSSASGIAGVGSTAFLWLDDGAHGLELWASDGSPGGTHLVADIAPGFVGQQNDLGFRLAFTATELNGRLVFRANDQAHGIEWWTSDGATATLLKNVAPAGTAGAEIEPGASDFAGLHFFIVGQTPFSTLWMTDGTDAGTADAAALFPPATTPAAIAGLPAVTSVGGLFNACDATNGCELWNSDGTTGGTGLVKDIRPGTASSAPGGQTDGNPFAPSGFAEAAGTVYFTANDGVHGAQLWSTDGTDPGTTLALDASPFSGPHELTASGTGLFFVVDYLPLLTTSLVYFDGTTATEVHQFPAHVVENGLPPQYSGITEMIALDGVAYFAPVVGYVGPGFSNVVTETWRSDGTVAGTFRISTVTGTGFRAVDHTVVFLGDDGQEYRTDGTVAGTFSLGVPGGLAVAVDATTAAWSANSGIWRTDGTAGNTSLVANVPSAGRLHAVPGGPILFLAGLSPDTAIWRTDGTSAGTARLLPLEIPNGLVELVPSDYFAIGSDLFFFAADEIYGTELRKLANTRTCGDGVQDAGEQCDDGNGDDGDACRNDCGLNVCGDDFLHVGVEQCDDGDTIDGTVDGRCCTATCGYAPAGQACAPDADPCTDDVCDASGTCTHPALSCSTTTTIISTTTTTTLMSPTVRDLLPGRVAIIKHGKLAKFVAKPVSGDAFALPTVDPMMVGGSLRIYDIGAAAGDDTYGLPAGNGWKGLGNPAGASGYKHRGTGSPTDPCKIVLVKESVIKAVCTGSAIQLAPPFAGDAAVILTVGTADRYCAQFGGDEVRNDASAMKHKDAAAPAACPP